MCRQGTDDADIKMHLTKIGYKNENWSQLVQGQSFLNMVMNIWFL
jgi:hypothetical protein